MPQTLGQLVNDSVPEKTVLILGSGASIPSGAPSVRDLIDHISSRFQIDAAALTLSEISALAEARRDRQSLIACVREKFIGLKAKGAILNMPAYSWKSIFSTNYDNLVEQAYVRADKALTPYSCNFDFSVHSDPAATKLFKIHGTIEKDVSDGHQSRMILTEMDYDRVHDYREALYHRLAADIEPGTQVLIIGQSLADRDLRDLVQKAVEINQRAMAGGRISLLLYDRDDNRASLYEMRGIKVTFGGLDELFVELSKKASPFASAFKDTGTPLDFVPSLRPVTLEVAEEAAQTEQMPAQFSTVGPRPARIYDGR